MYLLSLLKKDFKFLDMKHETLKVMGPNSKLLSDESKISFWKPQQQKHHRSKKKEYV